MSPRRAVNPDVLAIGKTVAGERARRGWSQTDLAVRAGMERTVVWEIEKGHGNPGVSTLSQIAAALGLGFASLVSGGDPEHALALRYWREELPEAVRAAYRERAEPALVLAGKRPEPPDAAERAAWAEFVAALDRGDVEEALALSEGWDGATAAALTERALAEVERRERSKLDELRALERALRGPRPRRKAGASKKGGARRAGGG